MRHRAPLIRQIAGVTAALLCTLVGSARAQEAPAQPQGLIHVERWYVVRDIGAALGDTNRFAPRKGHPDAFERHPFILGVRNGYVDFDSHGWYQPLVRERITPADVAWASNLLEGLSDRQWRDAFRAGGYEPEAATRFIRKLREKIGQGQAVTRRAAAR